jgi:hypothetical protein
MRAPKTKVNRIVLKEKSPKDNKNQSSRRSKKSVRRKSGASPAMGKTTKLKLLKNVQIGNKENAAPGANFNNKQSDRFSLDTRDQDITNINIDDSFASNLLKSKHLNRRSHTPNDSRLSLPTNLGKSGHKTPSKRMPDDKVLERLARGQKTKLSKKEIKDVNRRMYRKLPEVKKADELKKKQLDFRAR